MKDISDVFDIILLLVVLAVMLPFTFGAITDMNDLQSFGITNMDDKSMKEITGGIEANPYQTDTLSAAEIMLSFLIKDRPNTETERYILPDGSVIEITEDYESNKSFALSVLKSTLDSGKRYMIEYNEDAGAWMIVPV